MKIVFPISRPNTGRFEWRVLHLSPAHRSGLQKTNPYAESVGNSTKGVNKEVNVLVPVPGLSSTLQRLAFRADFLVNFLDVSDGSVRCHVSARKLVILIFQIMDNNFDFRKFATTQ